MSRKVYCYYECPTAEQSSQKLTAGCEITRQRAACREFAQKMGWDIVGEIEGSGVIVKTVEKRYGNE